MTSRSPDTSPETERVLVSSLRGLTVAERINRARSLSATVLFLARRAVERANPGLSRRELDLKFVACQYGEELAARLRQYLETKTYD